MLELGAGLLVDDERYVRGELEGGGGDACGDRAFDRLGNGYGFGRAARQQKNAFSFEDGADAHGDGTFRNFFALFEEFSVVVEGFLAENFEPRAGAQAGGWLVETDVSI